jgi:hypothetical protein
MRRTRYVGLFVLLASTLQHGASRGASLRLEQVSDVPFVPLARTPGDAPEFVALAQLHGGMYFSAGALSDGANRLFRVAGDVVTEFPVDPDPYYGLEYLANANSLYLSGNTGQGHELSRADGAKLDVFDLSMAPYGSAPHNFAALDGQFYFQAAPSASASTPGRMKLMTLENNVPQVVIDVENEHSFAWLKQNGDALYFPANGSDGFELHRLDSTGVHQVLDANLGPGHGEPWPLGVHQGELYFTARGSAGRELFRTDGEGTFKLPLAADPTGFREPSPLVDIAGGLYFTTKGANGYELFRTDGQVVREYDLRPGPPSSSMLPDHAVVLGDRIIMPGDGPEGPALFVFNAAGDVTNRMEIDHFAAVFPPSALRVLGDEAFFMGIGDGGADLYKTDGHTLTNLNLIPDGMPDAGLSIYSGIEFGDRLYFLSATTNGNELAWTDGTSVGWFDINPGAADSWPTDLQLVGEALVFRARGPQGDAVYAIENHTLQKIGDLTPNWFTLYNGQQALGTSSTSFARLGEDLYFLGNTPQGFRLHRVTAVPEPQGTMWIASCALALTLLRVAIDRR